MPFLLSLPQVLAHTRVRRGLPPDSLLSSGLAVLSPAAMHALDLCVLDVVIVTRRAAAVALRAWPLDGLSPDAIAVDVAALATLQVLVNDLPRWQPSASPAATPSPRRAARKRRPSRPGTGSASPSQQRLRPHTDASEAPDITVEVAAVRGAVPPARRVVLSPAVDAPAAADILSGDEVCDLAAATLKGRVVVPGQHVPVSVLGADVLLEVVSVGDVGTPSPTPTHAAREVGKRTRVVIEHEVADHSTGESCDDDPLLARLGGLSEEIARLQALAGAALSPAADGKVAGDGLLVNGRAVRLIPRGVLIHGPPGCGKTHLATGVAYATATHVEVVVGPALLTAFSGEAVRTLTAAFARARRRTPAVVLLDEVDVLAPRRDAPDVDNVQRKLTAALLTLLDGTDNELSDGVFVIGTSSRPDAIDSALRRTGRFDVEMEIVVPDARVRLEILNMLVTKAAALGQLVVSAVELEKIARITYGFVGADLSALWRESVSCALKRGKKAAVCYEDIRSALKVIRPSALREVVLEIPSTRWSDVGGKEDVKVRLQEAIEWPLTPQGAALFQSIGVDPPKGILLFGPPGCSKTLLARAVATESGANFISVKGAELLSKWVGESEKAVQRMFSRARQAAPCVIFFDEIDALATARSDSMGSSAQSRVVAQLLTEMDGIETESDCQKRVVVIAATNRPDCLDAAFLRPGRIDVQMYVGLPDEEERFSILKVHTRDVPITDSVNLSELSKDRHTGGFSGAELAALVREAALSAMTKDVENACEVTAEDFEQALIRVCPRTPPEVLQFFEDYVNNLCDKHIM